MKKLVRNSSIRKLLIVAAFLFPIHVFAQDGDQTIKLSLSENDSVKTCKAVVMKDTKPVAGIPVNIYIKRSVGLLPVATLVKTDENGEVSAEFPSGIPGDSLGNVTVIARLEDDDAIMDQKTICWGTKIKYSNSVDQKALWASRSNAPTYLIIISNAIILGIWGTMGYIIFLLFFKIKKSGMGYHP
jgi:hypothetical protein